MSVDSISIHTSRHYGYSEVGSKAVRFVKASRGQNISLLSMIKNDGNAGYMVHQGPINSTILADFLEKNLSMTPNGVPKPVLILDNVKFHHSPIIKEICDRKRVTITYLPAYSPQLNAIEEYFSIVKSKYNGNQGPKNTLDQIKDILDVSIMTINLTTYQNLYDNMRKWVEKALAGQIFI